MVKNVLGLFFMYITLTMLIGCNSIKLKTYTIEFETNDGSFVNPITNINKGSKIDLETPTKENYIFIGWYRIEGDKEIDVDNNTRILGDWTLHARWESVKYVVSFFDYDYKVIDIQNVEHGKDATSPTSPAREGYLFIGWDKELINIKSDLEVKAQYILTDYVNDDDANKIIFDEFISSMSSFEVSTTNFFTVTTDMISKNYIGETCTTTSQSSNIKTRLSPFYMETIVNDEHEVMCIKNGKIFNYTIPKTKNNDLYWIDLEYLGEETVLNEYFDLEDFLNSSRIDIISYNLDYKKILVEKIENGYKLSGLLRDYLPEEYYNEMKELYNGLGIGASVLDNSSFVMVVTLKVDQMIINNNVSIPINSSKQHYVEVSTNISYKFEEFEIIDIHDESQYYICKPNTIAEVYEDTDIFNNFKCIEIARPHYYRARFETGQYYFNDFQGSLLLEIYNDKGEKVDLGWLFGGDSAFRYGTTFTITEGVYYIKIKSTIAMSDGYQFVFTKLNYTDIFDYNNPTLITQGSFTFSIEGEYDIVFVNYIAETSGVIYVKVNSGPCAWAFYDDGITDGIVRNQFGSSSGNQLYRVIPGNNYFFLHGSNVTYDYTIEFIEANKYKNLDNTIDILKEEVDEWIITGPDLPRTYFKLDAEKGIYTFSYTLKNMYSDSPQFSIYDLNTNKSVSSSVSRGWTIVLEKGNYYVTVSSYREGIYKMDCEYKELKDDVEEIELLKVGISYVWDENFPSYQGYSYTNCPDYNFGKQFTITEKSNVLLVVSFHNYQLYNTANNRLLSFDNCKDVGGGIVYTLEAGTYLIKINSIYDSYSYYSLRVAILTCEIEDDYMYDLNNLGEIQLGYVKLNKDYTNDVDIVKFVVTKQSVYLITGCNTTFKIYDQNFKFVAYAYYSYTNEIALPVGTYYFVILPNDNSCNQFTINLKYLDY